MGKDFTKEQLEEILKEYSSKVSACVDLLVDDESTEEWVRRIKLFSGIVRVIKRNIGE